MKENIHVLMIEDDPEDAFLIQDMFEQMNRTSPGFPTFQWVHARTFTEGLKLLSSNNIDVVLLDFLLPDTNDWGMNTIQEIHKRRSWMPVIVLSGFDYHFVKNMADISGAHEYLVKDKLNGKLLSRSIISSIVRNHLMSDLQSKKEELQQAVEKDETYCRQLAEQNPDGMIVVNEDGVVRYINPAAEFLLCDNAMLLIRKILDHPAQHREPTELALNDKTDMKIRIELRIEPINWRGESARLALLREKSIEKVYV